MLLLMCYDYDQFNIIMVISFIIIIHQLVAKLIVCYKSIGADFLNPRVLCRAPYPEVGSLPWIAGGPPYS